jgi:hypothetical protein
MREASLGYNASFDRKKQYVQSRLHVDPDGFASRWNRGGAARASLEAVVGVGSIVTRPSLSPQGASRCRVPGSEP